MILIILIILIMGSVGESMRVGGSIRYSPRSAFPVLLVSLNHMRASAQAPGVDKGASAQSDVIHYRYG
jgi:hypothetical protein